MASITLSRSVFSSRRGSRHRDDLVGGGPGLPRHESVRNSIDPSPEDKIALPNTPFHNASNSLEGDSMKYPLDAVPPNRLIGDNFSSDFGRALLDDDRIKALGMEGSASGTSPSRPQGPTKSRNQSVSDKIPAMNNNIEWKANIFELPSTGRGQLIPESGLMLQNEENLGPPTRSRRQSRDGMRTPEHTSPRQVRKGSVPRLQQSPNGKEVVMRSARQSIYSVKSMANVYTRGADAPEVVPPQPQINRDGPPAGYQGPRVVQNPRLPQAQYPDGRRPSASAAVGNPHQQPSGRPLRPMQSSPALNHNGAPPPMSPAVPKPWMSMSRRPSAGSLRSMTSSDVNKPLPPEPPGFNVNPSPRPTQPNTPQTPRAPPTPGRRLNNVQGSTPSSPMRAQFLTQESRARTAPAEQLPKVALRSRFAKDLDALDDAFQRSAQPQYGSQPASAANMTFHDPLDTIRESPRSSQALDFSAPLQIARNTGKMVPTRRPPPTPKGPNRGVSPVRNGEASRNPSVPSTPRRPSVPQQRIETNVQQFRNKVNRAPEAGPSEPRPPETRPADVRPSEMRPLDTRPSEPPSRAPASPTVRRGGGRGKLQQLLGEDVVVEEPLPERGRFAPPQANLNRDVFEEPPPAEASQPMTRGGSITGQPVDAFRSGTSDAQFDEIRRRLDLLSPTSASENSFLSGEAIGQVLSNQLTGPTGSPQMSSDGEGPLGNSQPAPFAPAIASRAKSMSPIELPADMSWAAPTHAFEMDATEQPKVAVRPPLQPPPIPESPRQDAHRSGLLQRHSTVSSGTGRTKSLRSVKSARSARSAKARSLNSVAISEIQELYAGLPSPRTTLASRRPSITAEETIPEVPPMPEVMTTEELEELEEKDSISASVAEQVLYQILRNLHEPEDLFNASLVSRGFQRTFRRHDTKLLRHALWYTSGPAWEYLEMHMPISSETGQLEYPPNLYREQYIRDMRAMAILKNLILRYCGNILSRATFLLLCAKSSQESAPVDDAIWRIWTFCKIFGEDVDRREDLEMQKRWIKGRTMEEAQVEAQEQGGHRGKYNLQEYPAFAFGNDDGLTPEELIRMGEIWLCLRRLVRGYSGQRNEAREFGVFEGTDVASNDIIREECVLDEWTIHLLSLAPGTNVGVLAPEKATADNFIKAQQLGLTSWTPPGRNFTSSGFLTGPICSVLEEWLAVDPTMGSPKLGLRPSGMSMYGSNKTTGAPSRQTVQGFVSHIRTSQDGREFRRLLNGQRPDQTVKADHDAAQILPAETFASPAAAPPAPKSAKEGKKSNFSKFSIRLPSRSQTQAKKSHSRALAPPNETKAASAAPSPIDDVPSGAFHLFRNLTQRTRKNSAVKDERPTGLFASSSNVPNGRLSPGDCAVPNSQVSSQATLTDEADDGNDTAMPVLVAAERLLNMGFDQNVVDKVLTENMRDGRVNFKKMLKKIKKTKTRNETVMKLDRMG